MKKIIAAFFLLFSVSFVYGDELVSRVRMARHILLQYGPTAGCGENQEVCTSENFKKANSVLTISCEQNPEEFIFVFLQYDKDKSAMFDFIRGRPNGINTRLSLRAPKGCTVLAARRATRSSFGGFEETVYTPYSPEINTEEMRAHGMEYLMNIINQAEEALAQKGVLSRAFDGDFVVTPNSGWIALRLAIIEHIDPKRAKKEPISRLINEVVVTIGANEEGAYQHSVSKQKARGLFQFTPSTYELLLQKYPSALLEKDFVRGAENHINIAQAALLLFDLDTEGLSPQEKDLLLEKNLYRLEYLAAAYNGGSGPAQRAMRKNGALIINKLLRETRGYIDKLRKVHRAIS